MFKSMYYWSALNQLRLSVYLWLTCITLEVSTLSLPLLRALKAIFIASSHTLADSLHIGTVLFAMRAAL
jgi:hypothetical protein